MKKSTNKDNRSTATDIFFILLSIMLVICFLYFLVIVSFQGGDGSAMLTGKLAGRLAEVVFSQTPTEEQVATVNYLIRYGAHLFLFFILGYAVCYVSLLVFRHYFRVIGILVSVGVVYLFSYYTEYYKQFIDGRHFQMTDVKLNWIGGICGIIFMLCSYFLHKLLFRISET